MAKSKNSSTKRNAIYTLVLLAGALVIALFLFQEPDVQVADEVGVEPVQPALAENPLKEDTIANAWQWEADAEDSALELEDQELDAEEDDYKATSDLPFTEESVYQALQAVKIDSAGSIILDDDALNALNTALDHDEMQLDSEAIGELQTIIKNGLPGAAGEQTAQIVADYYQYLGAKNEFNEVYEPTNDESQYIENYESQYEELTSLRELYLGSEVSSKLFAISDANARYMFETKKLEANTSLSEEEKKQEQAKLVARHAEETTNVNDWKERYQAFLNEKQYIVNAAISDDEKLVQITELMNEHFSSEEQERVSHLQLDAL
jgi:lipase chaperone LimK